MGFPIQDQESPSRNQRDLSNALKLAGPAPFPAYGPNQVSAWIKHFDPQILDIADIDEFYYPVTEEEADIIIEGGLHPIDRKKVHLSGSIEKAIEAGKVRTGDPLILKIDGVKAKKDGIKIYQAGKDVYVTDSIDAKYMSKVEETEIKKYKLSEEKH